MRLEKTPGQPIDLAHDAIYILFIKDGKPQIVFVLSHEDPMKMAQDQHGVSYEGQRSWDEKLQRKLRVFGKKRSGKDKWNVTCHTVRFRRGDGHKVRDS